MPATVFVLGLLLQPASASPPDAAPVLEIVDARGGRNVLPVFEPPRERYALMYAPVLLDTEPEHRVGTLQAVGVRTFARDSHVVADVFLVLKGTPEQELPVESHTLRPGDSVVTTHLSAYGLGELTLNARLPPAVTVAAPPVESSSTVVRAQVTVVPGAVPLFRVELTNTSPVKGVYGIALRVDAEGGAVMKAPRGRWGRPLIAPLATVVEGFHAPGTFADGRFVPRQARQVAIDAVVFDDGSSEGEPGRVHMLMAWRSTQAWQVSRLLARVELALNEPGSWTDASGDALYRAAIDLGTAWDEAAVQELHAGCPPCRDVPPGALRSVVRSTADELLQEIEKVREMNDGAVSREDVSRIARDLRAWQEALADVAPPARR